MFDTEILSQLPQEVSKVFNKSIFELDGTINDTQLEKYLFYVPELIRLYSIKVVELKHKRRILQYKLEKRKAELLNKLLNDIDSHKYRNEQYREAYVKSDPQYNEIVKELIKIENKYDKVIETIWSMKSFLSALSDITKLRISEKKLI